MAASYRIFAILSGLLALTLTNDADAYTGAHIDYRGLAQIDVSAAEMHVRSFYDGGLGAEGVEVELNSSSSLSFRFAQGPSGKLESGLFIDPHDNSLDGGKRPVISEIHCSLNSGWFYLHEISRDASGRITRLALDFSHHCEGASNPASFGVVRYNSDVPVRHPQPYADAGLNREAYAGDAVKLDGSRSFDRDDAIASYRWRQTAGPAVTLKNQNAAIAEFVAPSFAEGVGVVRFELAVRDERGNEGREEVEITSYRRDYPRTIALISLDAESQDEEGPLRFVYDLKSGSIEADLRMRYEAYPVISAYINDAAGPQTWRIEVAPPYDPDLPPMARPALGLYAGIVDSPSKFLPQLTFVNDGRACTDTNGHTGWFELRELENAPDGRISRLALDIVEYCPNEYPKYGAIRINSVIPFDEDRIRAAAREDLDRFEFEPIILVGELTRRPHGIASVLWEQIDGPATDILSPTSLVTNAVLKHRLPLSGGAARYRLTVIAPDGSSSFDETTIYLTSKSAPLSFLKIEEELAESGSLLLHAAGSLTDRNVISAAAGLRVFPWDGIGYSLSFGSGDGSPLQAGRTYAGATYTGGTDAQGNPIPQMLVARGAAAILMEGNFTVHKFGKDEVGALTTVLTFESGQSTHSGVLNLNAKLPEVPNVYAGADHDVIPGQRITLNGSAQDPRGLALAYEWRQLAGPTITLDAAHSPNPSFVAPAQTAQAQQLTFELLVENGDGYINTDTLVLTVAGSSPPELPSLVFTASADTVPLGGSVSLQWSAPSATSCTASEAWTGQVSTQGTRSVKPAEAGEHRYRLTCNNATGSVVRDLVVMVRSSSEPSNPSSEDNSAGGGSISLGFVLLAISGFGARSLRRVLRGMWLGLPKGALDS